MISERFIEFIEEIVADGDWEYGDGTSMTEDAKIALAEIQYWYNPTIAPPNLVCEHIVEEEGFCPDCSNKLLKMVK